MPTKGEINIDDIEINIDDIKFKMPAELHELESVSDFEPENMTATRQSIIQQQQRIHAEILWRYGAHEIFVSEYYPYCRGCHKLKKHNSNYRVLYKKFKMFNEILMTAADLGFGDEYYFEKQGIVIAGSYNRKSMDKTKWYTVNIDKLNEILRSAQNEQMDCSKWTDGEIKMNNSSAQNE